MQSLRRKIKISVLYLQLHIQTVSVRFAKRRIRKMLEIKSKIKDIARSLSGECSVTLNVPEGTLRSIEEYIDKDLTLKISQYRPKRSKDANAYFWELCGKLSEKINLPPDSIYRELIKSVGGNYEVVPIRNDAVDTWIKNW